MPQALRWQLGSDLPDVDLTTIAKAALGLSGADVAALVRSARATARTERRPMCEADIMDAIVALRPPLDPALRWRVAIHEAGHAIVATATSGARPRLLTIESEGGGMHARAAASANTRAVLETRIAIALAGHAAETLILGAPSGGSGGGEESDLAFATQIAAMIEESLGLGETLVYLSPDDRAKDRIRIDPGQRRLIEGHLRKNHARATRLLEANLAQLIALATALDAEGILQGKALDDLLSAVIPEQGGDTVPLAPMAPADAAQNPAIAPANGQNPEASSDAPDGAITAPTNVRPDL
jgi:ATP-dependent Zn protease